MGGLVERSTQPGGAAPPTRGAPLEPRQTVWPTVIGVIFIIMASFGILANGCGVLINATLAPWFLQTVSRLCDGR